MRNCRNYNRDYYYFFFAWDLYSLFFIQGVFKSHLKKNHHHLKCQFPPKSQFDLSPSYKNVLKNGSTPGGGGCKLCADWVKITLKQWGSIHFSVIFLHIFKRWIDKIYTSDGALILFLLLQSFVITIINISITLTEQLHF